MADKTCEERINNEMAARFEDLNKLSEFQSLSPEDQKELLEDYGYDYDPDDEDTNQDNIYEIISTYHLAVSTYKMVRIELSTGGPGDYLELIIDEEDKSLLKGTYHFVDWRDGATRPLNQDQLETIENLYSHIWEY